jgi:putative SOS response-associated peptidase YedK
VVPTIWGLIPSWSEEPKAVPNARAETVATKPWFRDAFRKRRCLIPADGFYEWKCQRALKKRFFRRVDDEVSRQGMCSFSRMCD